MQGGPLCKDAPALHRYRKSGASPCARRLIYTRIDTKSWQKVFRAFSRAARLRFLGRRGIYPARRQCAKRAEFQGNGFPLKSVCLLPKSTFSQRRQYSICFGSCQTAGRAIDRPRGRFLHIIPSLLATEQCRRKREPAAGNLTAVVPIRSIPERTAGA